ncbi:MAG: O-antigen ligase family protein [Anaerolineae bacterium]|jgi:O-antigen ligase/Flp pilus assembly protein TadD
MKIQDDSPSAWIARIGEALWLIAAAAIPLVISPWTYNAFELPKTALLKALALLMGLVTLIHVIDGRKDEGQDRKTPIARYLLWPALAFGGVAALATLASVNPRVSLWGSYERQQGLLTLGAYLGLFLFTAANLRTRAQVNRLLRAIAWGSAPVVAYGLLQAAGIDPMDWRTDAASPALSTIGRANFLGSYLVLAVPLTAGLLLTARRRWPYVLLLVGQATCLVLTQARGAWIGLGAATVVGLFAWGLATRDRRPVMGALLLLILGVAFVILLNLPNGPLTALAHMPGLERVATLARTDGGSTAARLTIWQSTLPLITARPWLGYGPETMQPVFSRVFPPQLVYYQGRHATVDRAHNLWLDLGMSTGLAGTAAFAALLAGFVWLAWRGLRNGRDQWQKAIWAALAASIVGHMADLQFSFDLTASATIFWLALALGASVDRTRAIPAAKSAAPPQALLLYIPPTLVVLVLAVMLCVRSLMADAAYQQSLQSVQSLEAAQQAVRLWPLEPTYRLRLAEVLAYRGDPAAEAQLNAANKLCPNDPKAWATRGNIYALWGDVSPDKYAQAEAAYRRALELAPDIATYHTALGLILVQEGRTEDGLVELERAVDLDATDGVAFQHLAQVYETLGEKAKADWAQKEAERWNDE